MHRRAKNLQRSTVVAEEVGNGLEPWCFSENRRRKKKAIWPSFSRWHREADKMNCVRTTWSPFGLTFLLKIIFIYVYLWVYAPSVWVPVEGRRGCWILEAGVTGYSESLDVSIRPILHPLEEWWRFLITEPSGQPTASALLSEVWMGLRGGHWHKGHLFGLLHRMQTDLVLPIMSTLYLSWL